MVPNRFTLTGFLLGLEAARVGNESVAYSWADLLLICITVFALLDGDVGKSVWSIPLSVITLLSGNVAKSAWSTPLLGTFLMFFGWVVFTVSSLTLALTASTSVFSCLTLSPLFTCSGNPMTSSSLISCSEEGLLAVAILTVPSNGESLKQIIKTYL